MLTTLNHFLNNCRGKNKAKLLVGNLDTNTRWCLHYFYAKEMTSMINLKANKKTGTINVGVNPVTNITVNPTQPTTVQYPPLGGEVAPPSVSPQLMTSRDVTISEFTDDPEKQALLREIQVLRLIIELQHSNPLIVNKYIICDDDMLGRLVGLLCNAKEVHLDTDDLGSGCLTKNVYRKVNSIYVINENNETLNLKYDFPAVMKTLKDLKISVKFVF